MQMIWLLVNKVQTQMTGVRFDKTVNLGHILTFIGFVATIWVAGSTLNTRIVLLEERQRMQELRDSAQDGNAKDAQRDLKDALKDVQASVEKLADKLDTRMKQGK